MESGCGMNLRLLKVRETGEYHKPGIRELWGRAAFHSVWGQESLVCVCAGKLLGERGFYASKSELDFDW